MSENRYHMSASLQTTIRIGTVGMDQRQCNTLRMLFDTKGMNRYVLTEDKSPQIWILDLDVFGGKGFWNEFRERHPQSPLIIVSLNPSDPPDPYTLFVQKPIVITQLFAAIDQQRMHLAEELMTHQDTSPIVATNAIAPAESQIKVMAPRTNPKTGKAAVLMSGPTERTFVGTAPDIDPEDQDQINKITYRPELYLQGHFLRATNLAQRQKTNVAIEGPWPTIELLIDRCLIRVYVKVRKFRPYCTLQNTNLKVNLRPFGNDISPPPESVPYYYSAKAFQWQIALWASRGRVPEGTDLFQPVQLRQWPNFTRLAVTPHALAITALWAHEPLSLIETATILNIPQRCVFAFYSAADALQLVKQVEHEQTTPYTPTTSMRSENRGVFGKLLGYLRLQKPSSQTHSSEPRWS